jgi:hypothetical protein
MKEYCIKYRVVSVEDATLLIEYSCDGHDQTLVSIRKPYANETLHDVVQEYSPAYHWNNSTAEFLDVTDGISGDFNHTVATPWIDHEAGMSYEDVLAYRKKYAREDLRQLIDRQVASSPIVVDGHQVPTGTQDFANIAIYSAIASKDASFTALLRDMDGSYFYADADMIHAIAKEMADSVKDHIEKEKVIAARIEAETDKDKLKDHLDV